MSFFIELMNVINFVNILEGRMCGGSIQSGGNTNRGSKLPTERILVTLNHYHDSTTLNPEQTSGINKEVLTSYNKRQAR